MIFVQLFTLIASMLYSDLQAITTTQYRRAPRGHRNAKKIEQQVKTILRTDSIEKVQKEAHNLYKELTDGRNDKKDLTITRKAIAQETQLQNPSVNQAQLLPKTQVETPTSWLLSSSVPLVGQSYRLYLRFFDQKKYQAILAVEKERLAEAINNQAIKELKSLSSIITQSLKSSLAPELKKDLRGGNFYKKTTKALEGGALFGDEIFLSNELKAVLSNLSTLLKNEKTYQNKQLDPIFFQAIYEMNTVLKEAKLLMKQAGKIDKLVMYDADTIELTILKEYQNRNYKPALKKNSQTYREYLTSWITNKNNLKKAGIALAAIGGLYIFGKYLPDSLKIYAQSSLQELRNTFSNIFSKTFNKLNPFGKKDNINDQDFVNYRLEAGAQERQTAEDQLTAGKIAAEQVEREKREEKLLGYEAEDFATYHQEGADAIASKKTIAELNALLPKDSRQQPSKFMYFDNDLREHLEFGEQGILDMDYKIPSIKKSQDNFIETNRWTFEEQEARNQARKVAREQEQIRAEAARQRQQELQSYRLEVGTKEQETAEQQLATGQIAAEQVAREQEQIRAEAARQRQQELQSYRLEAGAQEQEIAEQQLASGKIAAEQVARKQEQIRTEAARERLAREQSLEAELTEQEAIENMFQEEPLEQLGNDTE